MVPWSACRMTTKVKHPRTSVLGEDVTWPALARDEILAACQEGVCPFCGQEALQVIGLHFHQSHGVSADAVRAHYGFRYRQSFSTPPHSARMSAINRQLMADRPDLRANLAAARRSVRRPLGPRRPQTIEKLRARGPEWGAALVRYRKTHPEAMRAYQDKAIAAAQTRYKELCADQEWLDQTLRRYPLTLRREITRRWQQGASLAELARAYDAKESSISDILAEQGVAGEAGRRQHYHHYRFSAEQEEEIVRRRAAGEHAADVAREFDCATSFVYYLARRRRGELIPRELELLRLLATPASREQIAAQLHIALKTMVYYLTIIYHKLGVTDRAEAVAKARELQLIAEED